jgi:hypothetical protein
VAVCRWQGRGVVVGTSTVGVGVGGLATTACVRVRDSAGEVVGSGFLVGPQLVATCAHVVADACGVDPYSETPPAAEVRIDFPMVVGGPAARSARVHRWVPIAEDGTGDVALLRLDGSAPPGSVMPPLRRVDRLWDHAFRVFGFPEGRSDGVWSTGRFRGGQGTGWFQLQCAPGDQPIEGGFSGAPVWEAETGAVVGMAVAADRDPTVTTGYLVPVEQVLGLDPELLPNPYRGLEPFEEEHAEYFFGRGPEVERLVAAVERSPLVAVAGPSGAGKSSLVKAGLLPRLRRDGACIVEVRARPGAPVLAEAMSAVLSVDDGPERDTEAIAAALADPTTRAEAASAVAGVQGVLVVDQFEELADAEPAAARELLAALAAAATADGSQIRVVLTLRGTAFDEVLTPDVAAALGSGSVFVGPLDRAQLRAAVVGPAERAPGLGFEDGLVERILDDAGDEPGQLPLVESLLAQLWTRREGGSLTMRGYEAAGGVAGALAAHAERVADTVRDPDGDDGPLRELCTRLAVIGRDGRARRRAVRLDELPAPLHGMVAVLAAARLVVVSGGAGGGTGGGTVELAHQSLIGHWPRLRRWLDADREFLVWRSEIDAARERWELGGRDDGALLRGAALEAAHGWVTERPGDLGSGQVEYVRRSSARQRREVRRWRTVAAVLAVLVLAAGAMTFVAVRSGAQVAAQLATVNADVIARESGARLGRDPMLAAELSLAAWRSDPDSASARSALADAYVALAQTDAVVHTEWGGGPVRAVMAAGGKLLAATPEPSVSLTAGVLGPEPAPLSAAEGASFATLSPDGSRLAVIAEDGALRLWEDNAGYREVEPARPGDERRSIGFSPDGNRVSWITGDTLHVHDIRSGTTASFVLPSGTTLVQLTGDPDLAVMKTDRGRVVRSITTGAEVRALPEGTRVVGGAQAVSCASDDPSDPGDADVLVVGDAVTDTELRRIPLLLLAGAGCTGYGFTLDGNYAVEHPAGPLRPRQSPAEASRIVDLGSGAAYQFVAPDIDSSAWQPNEAQAITALPTADGGLDVFVAVGPSVLRIPATREPPGLRSNSRTMATPGGLLLATNTSSWQETRFTSHDPVTAAQLAERTVAPGGNWGWYIDDAGRPQRDALWTLGNDGTGWHADRHALPDLTPTLRLAPPGPVDAENATIATATDGTTETVVVSVGSTLTAFDTRTGAQLGGPVPLAAMRNARLLWARTGHPGEAIVAAGGVLELWDVPSGRRLGSADLIVEHYQGVITRGDTLVALTTEGNIEVRRLPSMEQVSAPIAAPETMTLLGFDPDGRLVTGLNAVADPQIVFWDLEQRAEAGRIRASGGVPDSVDGGPFSVGGTNANLPQALDLRADVWRAHLCSLLPAELSDAATGLLPIGTDSSSPCN